MDSNHLYHELSLIVLNRFKQNDPFNSNSNPWSYMDKLDDWLRLSGIKPPKNYLPKEHGDTIFSQVLPLFICLTPLLMITYFCVQIAVEKDAEFVDTQRRPRLWNGFSTVPQLLGVNVILKYNETSKTVSTKLLRGAGTVEQILAKLMNQSILMLPNR